MKKNLILEWNEGNEIDEEVKHIREEPELNEWAKDLTDDELRQSLYDGDYLATQWDFFKESLNEYLTEIQERFKKKHKDYFDSWAWKTTVKSFGWLNRDGWKEFNANDSEEFLRELLPETDCSFYIYKHRTHGLKIQNYHHDSPTGNEFYYIYPTKYGVD